MALYAYYKLGPGLFTDAGGGMFEDANGNEVSEGFLQSQAFQVMRSFKLLADSWEFAADDIFASQPGVVTYRFVSTTDVKFLLEEYVTQGAYFVEIQFLPEFIL